MIRYNAEYIPRPQGKLHFRHQLTLLWLQKFSLRHKFNPISSCPGRYTVSLLNSISSASASATVTIFAPLEPSGDDDLGDVERDSEHLLQ
jgi:hypothetical protein